MRAQITAAIASIVVAVLLLPATATAATIETSKRGDENGFIVDNGTCTLREAIIAANTDTVKDACTAGSGADRIVLRKGTYNLSVPGGDGAPGSTEIQPETGDLDIDGLQRLTLIGHRKGTTIDGNGHDRVFQIFGKATLRGLTIRGGAPPFNLGGGIHVRGADSNGDLTLIGSTVTGNTSAHTTSGGGSGIAVAGSGARLEMTDSKVVDNDGYSTAGIDTVQDVTLIITRSTIAGNGSTGGHGTGGLNLGQDATATVRNSTIRSNEGAGLGGGGFSTFNSDLTVIRTRVLANRGHGDGGGFELSGGNTTIRDSEVSGNFADDSGGGIATSNTPNLSIVNSTVSSNTAYADGVFDASYEDGGGLALVPALGTIRVINSTIAGNHAYRGGGVLGGTGSTGTAKFRGTLIAENTSVANANTPDCFGDITSLGNNLLGNVFVDPTLCTVTPLGTDKVNVAAEVAALADNGGPTRTHALRPGSKAINNGPGNAPKTDQRGVKRNNPDIGAYERAAAASSSTASAPTAPTACAGPTAPMASSPSAATTASTASAATTAPAPVAAVTGSTAAVAATSATAVAAATATGCERRRSIP